MKQALLFSLCLSLISCPCPALGLDGSDQSGFIRSLIVSGRYQIRDTDQTVSNRPLPSGQDKIRQLQALTYLQGYEPPVALENVVSYDKKLAFPGENLLVSAHAPEASLRDMKGRVLHQWHFDCGSLPGMSKEYCTDYWVKAALLPEGNLLVLFPYVGLIKIDKNSNLIWFYKTIAHHDFDMDKTGRIYLLTMRQLKMPDGLPKINEYVTLLSPDGKKEKEISMMGLFKDYPDPGYFRKIMDTSLETSPFFRKKHHANLVLMGDCLHSNSIQALDNGLLLVSVLRLEVLILVDPVKEKIVRIIGPPIWKGPQHSARVLKNKNILIFQNYYTSKLSRIVEFTLPSGAVQWTYENPTMPLFSKIYGRCDRLPNGNTLILDSVHGHAFEVTPDKKIVWDFYNPYRVKNGQLTALLYQMQRIYGVDLSWLKNNQAR